MNSSAFLKFFREDVGMFCSKQAESLANGPGIDLSTLTYVVDGHQSAVRPADLTVGILKTLKGLRRGHLVHKVAIYCRCQRVNNEP